MHICKLKSIVNTTMNQVNSKPSGKESDPKIPTDLLKSLVAAPKSEAIWKGLTTLARRDFISWIESAKQLETRKRRIDRTSDMLLSGKRRPCCYAIVPMNLYKALDNNSKAKAQWKNLTSIERRDFSSWVESAKLTEEYKCRIEKVCVMLVAGKRRP